VNDPVACAKAHAAAQPIRGGQGGGADQRIAVGGPAGRDFVTDSVKSARSAAGSVRKNVAETVVLVREAVGV
jgi:hypothetical protein